MGCLGKLGLFQSFSRKIRKNIREKRKQCRREVGAGEDGEGAAEIGRVSS